jgi:hypothetical protein
MYCPTVVHNLIYIFILIEKYQTFSKVFYFLLMKPRCCDCECLPMTELIVSGKISCSNYRCDSFRRGFYLLCRAVLTQGEN